jgi:hypothetical protein
MRGWFRVRLLTTPRVHLLRRIVRRCSTRRVLDVLARLLQAFAGVRFDNLRDLFWGRNSRLPWP